ncbi:MAG: hypothetical protein AAGF46_12385 [Pseudomonadota bacterium]
MRDNRLACRRRRATALYTSVLAALGLTTDAVADGIGFVVQSASDTIYHGTPETGGEPFLATTLTWQATDLFFAGASARVSPVPNQRQRHHSYDLFAGTSLAIDSNWLTTFSAVRREFPGSQKAWQYTEYRLELAHERGFQVRLEYAPDYYAHKTEATVLELRNTHFLGRHSYWQIGAGGVALSRKNLPDYYYAELGVGVSSARWTLDVSYGWNSEDGSDLFGGPPIRSPGVVFSVAYRAL